MTIDVLQNYQFDRVKRRMVTITVCVALKRSKYKYLALKITFSRYLLMRHKISPKQRSLATRRVEKGFKLNNAFTFS